MTRETVKIFCQRRNGKDFLSELERTCGPSTFDTGKPLKETGGLGREQIRQFANRSVAIPKKKQFSFLFLKEGEPRSGKQHWCICLGLELQALLAIRKANSAAVGCCGCGFSAGGPIERGRNEADIKGNLARRYTYMTYEAFLLVGVIQTSCDYCFVHK
jgi:hypothetical protein